jgi:hypothetical protein
MSRPHPFAVVALRFTLLSAIALLAPRPADADTIRFQFGVSSPMTLVENQEVGVPAAIVNAGTEALIFGCARVPCGGLDFGASFAPDPMWPSNFEFGPSGTGAITFYDQFVGLTLNPGERFDFVVGRLNIFATPLGTGTRPTVGFRIGRLWAYHSPQVIAGTEVSFGPVELVDNQPAPVPEPATLLLMGPGLVYLLRRRRTGRSSVIAARV